MASEPLTFVSYKTSETKTIEWFCIERGEMRFDRFIVEEKGIHIVATNGFHLYSFDISFDSFRALLKNSNYTFAVSSSLRILFEDNIPNKIETTKTLIAWFQESRSVNNLSTLIHAFECALKGYEQEEKFKKAETSEPTPEKEQEDTPKKTATQEILPSDEEEEDEYEYEEEPTIWPMSKKDFENTACWPIGLKPGDIIRIPAYTCKCGEYKCFESTTRCDKCNHPITNPTFFDKIY